MTNGLKPCPFHKEVVIPKHDVSEEMHRITCADDDCPACNDNWFESEDDAIKAWNTRYKLTCKMEPDQDYDLVTCSNCGYEEEIHILFPSNGLQVFDGMFCPQCGAEVVDG